MSLATTIKSIQDIMRKDVGVDGDAQRIGQLVWLLFLKIWDDRERELELIEDDFCSPLVDVKWQENGETRSVADLRWSAWATDPEGITGDGLLDFTDKTLFPALKGMEVGPKVDGDSAKAVPTAPAWLQRAGLGADVIGTGATQRGSEGGGCLMLTTLTCRAIFGVARAAPALLFASSAGELGVGLQTREGRMDRNVVRGATAIVFALMALAPAAAVAQEIKVTLLGTGTPVPAMNRFGPSILVEAAGQKFLFDAGRGALQRLAQLRVRWQDVDGVFLTHLHSDHVVGFPDLWLTGWLVGPGRDRPLHVWGPRGTTKMMSHLEQAYEFDIRMRLYDDRAAPDGVVILAEDIDERVVLDKGGLKIMAFEVDHAPIRPAFGYRVDYGGRSVVLSGDTRVSQNLIRHAQGADLLVHEVASPESFQRAGVRPERAKSVIEHHVTPEQAGEIFAKTKPRLAVYSHIVMPDTTEQDLIPPTRKMYSGPVEIGEDLMVILVGEKVEVRRPVRSSP